MYKLAPQIQSILIWLLVGGVGDNHDITLCMTFENVPIRAFCPETREREEEFGV
eukprot:TRINITY_DN2466_c0_g1_i1.p1 TRINITY_DN2466_c0_g1~~TRINITY_DN2466_c0_g1_i1.p1  ORF type:complete len:54 (-),score=8.63 TRINITY_DN2466_c0_g1_i1:93-254(-)